MSKEELHNDMLYHAAISMAKSILEKGLITEEEVRDIEGNPEPEPKPPEGFVFTRALRYGCQGEDVCELKKLLNAAGFTGLTVTNKNYLSKTKAKVKAYQKAAGLEVDGKAGPLTIAALGGTYRK